MFTPSNNENIMHVDRESTVLNSPSFQDKLKLKQNQNQRKTSKANLYTPKLKMSFWVSHQITPVLKSKKEPESRNNKSGDKSKVKVIYKTQAPSRNSSNPKHLNVVQKPTENKTLTFADKSSSNWSSVKVLKNTVKSISNKTKSSALKSHK